MQGKFISASIMAFLVSMATATVVMGCGSSSHGGGGSFTTSPSPSPSTTPSPSPSPSPTINSVTSGLGNNDLLVVTGQIYTFTFGATGGTAPYLWQITTGSLPQGLSFSQNGTISGTATTTGNSAITVTVTDANQRTGSQNFTVTVFNKIAITPNPPPAATHGQSYSVTFTATGGVPPYSNFSASGASVPGLTFASGSTSETLSGTPTTAGTYNFNIAASDSTGTQTTFPVTLTVN